jgi:putative ABC transport system substrate-binding protein
VVANDFFDSGHGSGKLAARVLRGENPGAIPFQATSGTKLLLNGPAAERCGLKLPAALRDRAHKVVE